MNMADKIQFITDVANFDPDHSLVSGDYLVVTGDVYGCHAEDTFLDWCSNNYRHTFIVMGNRDYYCGQDVSGTLISYSHDVRSNVTYVNNISQKIGNIELFFTTLWRPCGEDDMPEIISDIEDFEHIICNGRYLTLHTQQELHRICVQWLLGALSNSAMDRRIVVSHHGLDENSSTMSLLESAGMDELISSSCR